MKNESIQFCSRIIAILDAIIWIIESFVTHSVDADISAVAYLGTNAGDHQQVALQISERSYNYMYRLTLQFPSMFNWLYLPFSSSILDT